ncbi:hypothetical protein TRVL_09277 [Trypanosoma vivax]|nr:hypothetical protein TRVL_09277 [Trypanosoma vivax]
MSSSGVWRTRGRGTQPSSSTPDSVPHHRSWKITEVEGGRSRETKTSFKKHRGETREELRPCSLRNFHPRSPRNGNVQLHFSWSVASKTDASKPSREFVARARRMAMEPNAVFSLLPLEMAFRFLCSFRKPQEDRLARLSRSLQKSQNTRLLSCFSSTSIVGFLRSR